MSGATAAAADARRRGPAPGTASTGSAAASATACCKLWTQTTLAPVVSSLLFIVVFGLSLGDRINQIGGFDYEVFIVPGLIAMAMAQAAYSNNASTIFQGRSDRFIDDVLASPMHAWQMNLGYLVGGAFRALIIGGALVALAAPMTGAPVEQPLLLLVAVLLLVAGFGALGTIVGIYAETFDHTSFINNIVILPLTFLGGVFYSVERLGSPWEQISHANPLFYVVDAVRYGFLGVSDVSARLSFAVLAGDDPRPPRLGAVPVLERAEAEAVENGRMTLGFMARFSEVEVFSGLTWQGSLTSNSSPAQLRRTALLGGPLRAHSGRSTKGSTWRRRCTSIAWRCSRSTLPKSASSTRRRLSDSAGGSYRELRPTFTVSAKRHLWHHDWPERKSGSCMSRKVSLTSSFLSLMAQALSARAFTSRRSLTTIPGTRLDRPSRERARSLMRRRTWPLPLGSPRSMLAGAWIWM